MRRAKLTTICGAVALFSACGETPDWIHSPGEQSDGLSNPEREPGQFIVKLYTEVLGRAPDPGGWQAYSAAFRGTECSQDKVSEIARSFLLSNEFWSRDMGFPAKVIVLYRALLNREPDLNGYNHHLDELFAGRPWETKVDDFLRSPEFAGLVPRICSRAPYGWGTAPVIPTGTGGGGDIGGASEGQDGAYLQDRLDELAASGGGTLYLKRRAVIYLDAPLTIPSGVSLATYGELPRTHYAAMGRLVRRTPVDGYRTVILKSHSQLRSVWVDGQHGKLAREGARDQLVNAWGTDVVVRNCRLSDGEGTQLYLADRPHDDVETCNQATIEGNLITAYPAKHMPTEQEGGAYEWSDGITNRCGNATIRDNHIVDVTDVGIVIFHPGGDRVQNTVVENNRIVAAGNAMVSGLTIDPQTGLEENDTPRSFAGTRLTGNLIWSGLNTHIDLAISVGTRAWFSHGVGFGGLISGNSSSNIPVRVNTGVIVGTINSVTVSNNPLATEILDINGCPTGARVVVDDVQDLSGVEGPYTTAPKNAVVGCVAH